jgi:hypothetical protein
MVIGIDFDGTCVTHEYPKIGRNIGAESVLKELVDNGNNLILLTMRSGTELEQAMKWFYIHKIHLSGINENPEQRQWTSSPKIYANLYIDDAGLRMPLIYSSIDRPYVDWIETRKLLIKIGLLK